MLYVGAGHSFDYVYNFGPTPDNPAPHAYRFLYDGKTGAEIYEDRIVFHFRDGQRGDNDLANNGTIVIMKAPTLNPSAFPYQNPLSRKSLPAIQTPEQNVEVNLDQSIELLTLDLCSIKSFSDQNANQNLP